MAAINVRAFLNKDQIQELNRKKRTDQIYKGLTNQQVAEMLGFIPSTTAAPPASKKAATPPAAAEAVAPPPDPMAGLIIVPNEEDYNPDRPLPRFVPDAGLVVPWTAAIGDNLTHWTQFEPWVRNYYTQQNPGVALAADPVMSDPSPADRLRKITVVANDRQYTPALVESYNQDMRNGKWKTVNTYGEGTCQTHAILFGLSESYRKMSHAQRGPIAQRLRTHVFAPFFQREIRLEVLNNKQRERLWNYPESIEYIRDIGMFLTDWHLGLLRAKYGFNVFAVSYESGLRIVKCTLNGKELFIDITFHKHDPVVFIYNRMPAHFSAIYLGRERRFILTLKEFLTHYTNLNRVFMDDMLKTAFKFSPAVDREHVRRRAINEMIENAASFDALAGRLDEIKDMYENHQDTVRTAYNRIQERRGNMDTLLDYIIGLSNQWIVRVLIPRYKSNIFRLSRPFFTDAIEENPNIVAVRADIMRRKFDELPDYIEGYEQQLGLPAGTLQANHDRIAEMADIVEIKRLDARLETAFFDIPQATHNRWRARREAAAGAAAGGPPLPPPPPPPPAANGMLNLKQAEANELKKIRDEIMSKRSVTDDLKEQVIELKFEAWQNKRDTRKRDAIAKAAREKFNGDPEESIKASSAVYKLLLHNEKDEIPNTLRQIATSQGISENFYLDIWNKTFGGGRKSKTRSRHTRYKKRATRHKRR